jgi:lipopolysaccharide/colanic/teichoic acid biosynthesis glycosyltransferase
VSSLARDTPAARTKHVLDRMLAAIALVVFSPLLVAITVWILLETGRPVLFAHPRVGKNGRVFRMLKFRTMVQDAIAINQAQHISEDPYGHLPDDPRITRSGRFLRRTSLDELPQFFNILLGDMSLIGPRPIVEAELAKYDTHAGKLLSVRPGLSGIWQVQGRSDTSYTDRVRLDMFYIDHRCMWMDIQLLLLTLPAVFSRRGAA